jgi:hypothetical protein
MAAWTSASSLKAWLVSSATLRLSNCAHFFLELLLFYRSY